MRHKSGYNYIKTVGETVTHGNGEQGMSGSDEEITAVAPAEYPDNEQVAANMRWRKNRLAMYRKFWAFAWLLMVAFLVEAWIAAWYSPRNYIYRLDVRNVDTMTKEEVIQLAGVKPGTNYFRVPLQDIAGKIKAQDQRVDNVVVERGAMGTLVLLVNERKAVCRLGTSEPALYLDKKGYLFSRPVPPATPVPVLSGVEAPDEKNLGKKLTESYVAPVLSALAVLPSQTDKGVALEIASLKFDEQSGATYELANGITIEYGTLTHPAQKAAVIKSLIDKAITLGNTAEQIKSLNVTSVDNKNLSGTYNLRTPAGGGTQ